jgi:hypothetical protein
MITNLRRSSSTFPTILLDFNETSILSKEFRKVLKYEISWKSVLVEADADGQAEAQTEGQIWHI